MFAGAARNRTCAWFLDSMHPFHATELPNPVLGISRYLLDQRLAESFIAEGGELSTGDRANAEPGEGKIIACGRPAGGPPKWVGLKAHLRDEPLAADLEVHLGRGGYIGLARIESNLVNACGLFPATAVRSIGREEPKLAAAAQAIGLTKLALRLREADWVEGASAGCVATSLGWQNHRKDPTALAIGDAAAMIPPFTGNGMTMAMQAGGVIVPHLEAWVRGYLGWPEAVSRARSEMDSAFQRRMRWSGLGHPMFLRPGGQKLVAWLARHRLLPFHLLFRLTH
jgi:menaquinone-9 beta-reductase